MGYWSQSVYDPALLAGGMAQSLYPSFPLSLDAMEVAPSLLEEPTESLSEGQPMEDIPDCSLADPSGLDSQDSLGKVGNKEMDSSWSPSSLVAGAGGS